MIWNIKSQYQCFIFWYAKKAFCGGVGDAEGGGGFSIFVLQIEYPWLTRIADTLGYHNIIPIVW